MLSVVGAVRSLDSSLVAYAMSGLFSASRDNSCVHFYPVVPAEFWKQCLLQWLVMVWSSPYHTVSTSQSRMQCSLTHQYRHRCTSVFDLRSLQKFGGSVLFQLSVRLPVGVGQYTLLSVREFHEPVSHLRSTILKVEWTYDCRDLNQFCICESQVQSKVRVPASTRTWHASTTPNSFQSDSIHLVVSSVYV